MGNSSSTCETDKSCITRHINLAGKKKIKPENKKIPRGKAEREIRKFFPHA